MNFEQLSLCDALLRAIAEAGYTEPTAIQAQAIPTVLAGRDVLGCAQTGTGKTAAFALPILQRLGAPREKQSHKRPIRALILTPTRELALQIQENCKQYSKYTGLNSVVIFGGVSQKPQVEQLQKGADLLIATPGRLWDLIGQKIISLSHIACFVLDEADRMLDMGFFPEVKRIIRCLPAKRQTLLFSATMPQEIQQLADSLLTNPVHVSVTPVSSTVDTIAQSVYMVDRCNKRALLTYLIRQKGCQQTLVFTRTKHGADRVARELSRNGISAAAIHGDKSQGARQRALSNFKENKICVLVATDIAARGIDISGLPYVINFDLPEIPETYVHRIGRTGRAGMEGIAISLCDGAQTSYLIDIEELTGKRIEEVQDHPYPMTGEQPETTPAKPERKSTPTRRKRKEELPTANTRSISKPVSEASSAPLSAPKRHKRPQKSPVVSSGSNELKQKPQNHRHKKTSVQNAEPAKASSKHAHKIGSSAAKSKRSMPSRGNGRGGRRVIDNDSAQMEVRTLPNRELSDAVRAKIAAKIAVARSRQGK